MRFIFTFLAIVLIAFVGLGATAPTAMADEVVNIWIGDSEDPWDDPDNWSRESVPTDEETAKINNETIPYVYYGDEVECRKLVIEDSGSGLFIEAGGVLTVGDGGSVTSRIEDDCVMEIQGTLEIWGEQTFEGVGTIRLSQYNAVIAPSGSSDLLVLATECQSSPISRSCSITLAGYGEVSVALENKAFVVADEDEWLDPLRLTGDPKTTSNGDEAYWICENGGVLRVSAPVNGSGHWWVRDVTCNSNGTENPRGHGCNGTIHVSGGCVTGTGDVFLETGWGLNFDHQLKVESEGWFCTTGELTWRSVAMSAPSEAMSRPSILVKSDASARFSVSAATCALCEE